MLWGFFWSLLMFLIVITLLVAFHEYGHFIVARACGVKVLRFSIGFGKILWSRNSKKGTEFVISILPIGGYVKMLDERVAPVKKEDLPFAFNRKSVLQRSLIVLAGPFFNFIFAIAAYWLMLVIGITHVAPIVGEVAPGSIAATAGIESDQEFVEIGKTKIHSWQDVSVALVKEIGNKTASLPIVMKDKNGIYHYKLMLGKWAYNGSDVYLLESLGIAPSEPLIPPIIAAVQKDSPAAGAKLRTGDEVIAIDGQSIKSWQAMVKYISSKPNQLVQFTIKRNNSIRQSPVKIGQQQLRTGQMIGFLGIQSKHLPWPSKNIRLEKYSPFKALEIALNKTYDMSITTLKLLGKMLIGDISVKGLSGPVGIAQGAGFSASLGFAHFLSFLALVSVSLGVLNLLPLPMLDGGHFLFFIIEAIIKRPIPEKVQEFCMKVGILLLISVMLLALYNDLSRF